MSAQLVLAIAQSNPAIGALDENTALLRAARAQAASFGADLLITSELSLTGYPVEDMAVRPAFLAAVEKAVYALAKDTADGGPALLIGAPWRDQGNLYNAALLLDKGVIAAAIFKQDLPNYGPFDEKRVFTAASHSQPVPFRCVRLGIMICEDMWKPPIASALKRQGAEILITLNGSPYDTDKAAQRHRLAASRVAETGLPLIYVNQFGGQDELVFDGASFALNAKCETVAALPAWENHIAKLEFKNSDLQPADNVHPQPRDPIADTYHALMIGLRDYVDKNGFAGVILGLSGGIDSALSATLAVDALGAQRVRGVMMPSPYTSQDSLDDARAGADALGMRLDTVAIGAAMQTFDAALTPLLGAPPQNVTHENIQSRSRGVILMALSNATGWMVLSTGNKSEMAVGYATLYGDMCGGFAALKDVYKTQVYALSRWRNAHKPASALGPDGIVIPERVLTKAPSAELRPGQKDQDSLPPYDSLDDILACLIERDMSLCEIAAQGHDPDTVARIAQLLARAEYKRRQSPPGVKITPRTLSRDRRYPITNKFREQL